MVQYGIVLHGMVYIYGTFSQGKSTMWKKYHMVLFPHGTFSFWPVWYGMVWYGMVRYGMLWYGGPPLVGGVWALVSTTGFIHYTAVNYGKLSYASFTVTLHYTHHYFKLN